MMFSSPVRRNDSSGIFSRWYQKPGWPPAGITSGLSTLAGRAVRKPTSIRGTRALSTIRWPSIGHGSR